MTLIIDGNKMFRPAGYRLPIRGEYYIGSDGRVKYIGALTKSNNIDKRTILKVVTGFVVEGDK